MSPSLESGVLRFEDFELDVRSGELRKGGGKIRLQEQPFKILVLLLDRPGEVITREELRHQLWPSDTFVAFDDGLNTAIKKLRQALDDAADTPRFVETLPRRGYRFIAPVEAKLAPGTAEPTFSVAPTDPLARPTRWISVASAALVLLAIAGVLAAAGWLGLYRVSEGSSPVLIRSVAVLPFVNLSGDSSQEYFADGMTDELITNLAKISSLRVISRTSVMPYKGAQKTAPEIARALNVDGIVEGSVMRAANRVRITTQLVQAATDRHLWAESYERELQDVLSLQHDVAGAIARQIKVTLTPQERASLGGGRPVNPVAYDNYLRAIFHSRRATVADNQVAISLLEQVVAQDPTFALAYAELGRAYSNRGFRYAPEDPHWQERAFVAIEKALALDPDLADAHLARGVFLWTYANHFPHEQAAREQHRALAQNPNLAEAHQQLALIYNHIGLLDRALEESRKAVALNPGNRVARNRIGETLLFQGKYEEALAAFRNVRQDGDTLIFRHLTVSALVHLGRKSEALQVIRESLAVSPEDLGGLLAGNEAVIAALDGDHRAAETNMQRAIQRGKTFGHFHHTAYAIASAYALMNKPDRAIEWLQAAARDGFPCYPLFASDPNLDHLRHDRRFVAFLDGLKAQWEDYRAALGS
jgi:TolB-like protein/DNA-binding winged helix-turn-helix (wHTH) protein/Tfp pilus assembly protein PilF